MNLAVQAISIGHALDTGSMTGGVVHSVFSHAVNLLIDEDLWTLLAAGRTDLPFGIRVAMPGLDGFAFRRGEAVRVKGGWVNIGSRIMVDCRTPVRWSPVPEPELAPGFVQRLARVAEAVHQRSWLGTARLAQAMKAAMPSPAELNGVLRRVVGCGPGATPSGDDLLVGIFAVLNSPLSGEAGARDAARLREALLPLLPTTTDLSAHLLRQAADGLFSRDLHELVSSLAAESFPGQLPETLRRVLATGATSGADMCEGLLAFAPSYFIPQPERAAA